MVNPYRDRSSRAPTTRPRSTGSSAVGAERVAAFLAEPISGATLGAVVPPDDYWPAVADVLRSHGVLLIMDEVMTGFGRTGRWFGADHWGLRPDILTSAKGVSSGYWPLGLCIASRRDLRHRHRGRHVLARLHVVAPPGGRRRG